MRTPRYRGRRQVRPEQQPQRNDGEYEPVFLVRLQRMSQQRDGDQCHRRARRECQRQHQRQSRTTAALITAAVLCAACSFEYTDAGAAPEQLLEHIPETELTGVTRTIVRDGRVVAEVRAEQVWNFRRRARTILHDVHYTEYDAAGNAVTTGSAERAVYYTEREDVALSGSIRLRSEAQGVTVQAQALRWEDARRRLVSTPGDAVEFYPRRLPGARRRPGGRRAPQDHPLLGGRQRHPGHGVRPRGLLRRMFPSWDASATIRWRQARAASGARTGAPAAGGWNWRRRGAVRGRVAGRILGAGRAGGADVGLAGGSHLLPGLAGPLRVDDVIFARSR